MSWFALGLKILSCNICAMNKEQYSNSNLLNPRLYEFETTLHAMYMNMIQTACRNKEIDIWCFLPGQINWTCLAQFFSVSDFKIWRKKKSDLNYIHSHEFLISVIIFFFDLKIYILLQKKLDNGIPYPEVRKGFVFYKTKNKIVSSI